MKKGEEKDERMESVGKFPCVGQAVLVSFQPCCKRAVLAMPRGLHSVLVASQHLTSLLLESESAEPPPCTLLSHTRTTDQLLPNPI